MKELKQPDTSVKTVTNGEPANVEPTNVGPTNLETTNNSITSDSKDLSLHKPIKTDTKINISKPTSVIKIDDPFITNTTEKTL